MSQVWQMYAAKRGDRFAHAGRSAWWVKQWGDKPVVPVNVTLNESGPYYGWIERGEDTPCMIQPARMLFEMQFPYGVEPEVERGRGRVVRLDIAEREAER